MTPTQERVLRSFRGTGEYVGKDAFRKSRRAKPNIPCQVLYDLRSAGYLEHSHCNEWFLTDKGKDFVYRGIEAPLSSSQSLTSSTERATK